MARKGKYEIARLVQRNGVYTIAWTDPPVKDPATGRAIEPARSRRIGLRTRDADEAKARYAAFLTQGSAVFGRSRSIVLTVADALDDYYREHVRESVIDKIRQENAIHHLKEFFGDLPFDEVDIPKCRGYADARRAGVISSTRLHDDARKAASATVRRELGVLRAAAAHAARWRRLGPSAAPATAMPTFELPTVEVNGHEVAWIDKDGIRLLFDASKGPLHDFIALAYAWAARRGWVERLRVEQVDLRNGRVQPYRQREVRTAKRRVVLPVFPEIQETLERLVRDATDGWLFGSGRANFYWQYRRLCELAGFEDRAHPHILRHSRATHLLMDGHSIYAVARLLGDTVRTVERTYGHHSVEYLREIGQCAKN